MLCNPMHALADGEQQAVLTCGARSPEMDLFDAKHLSVTPAES